MTVTPDLILINALVALVIPMLVALLAKAHAPSALKSWLALVLAAVAGVLTPLVSQPHVDWRSVALSILEIFAATVVAHTGLLRPIGVTGADGAIAAALPGGLGTEPAAGEQG